VLAGRGTRRFAGDALMKFLDAASIPVLHSISSFGSVSFEYDKRLGDVKLWNGAEALDAAAQADLLLIFEADEPTARFAQEVVKRNPSIKVVQSADLAAGIGSFVPVEVGLLGTVGAVLRDLSERVNSLGAPENMDDDWVNRLIGLKSKIEDEYLQNLGPASRVEAVLNTVDIVADLLRPEDYVVCDGPLASGAALAKLKHPALHRAVMIEDDYIPGAGLPVALGLKAGSPNSRVFLVTETGRFKRHSRELQSARRYGLAVTSFLFQEAATKPDEEVDFAMLSKSLGVQAQSITEPVEEITPDVVEESFKSESGTLFDASRF